MDLHENPDYFDLDDILTQAQSVDCKFLIDIPGLGCLFPNQEDKSEDATQGSDLLLPFWMARTLYVNSVIDIVLPSTYKINFQENLVAEALVVDLHKAGPHYYHFGRLLMGLRREYGNNLEKFTEEGQRNKYRREEGETLVDKRALAFSLMTSFHRRREKILEYSINASAGEVHRDYHQFGKRLDNMEKRLFQIGKQQLEQLRNWTSRKIEMVLDNEIAKRLNKKRKLESSKTTQNVS